MPLDFNELRQLLVTLATTDIVELTLKSDDFELTVRKAYGANNQLPGVEAFGGGVVGSRLTSPAPAAPSVALGTGMEMINSRGDINVNAGGQLPANAPSPLDQRLVDITSPMVGTFYRSPAPGEPSFVEAGDRIRSGQTVCIIEAMKLMNEIEAEVSGQIMEILVENGQPVEFGQALMRIKPD